MPTIEGYPALDSEDKERDHLNIPLIDSTGSQQHEDQHPTIQPFFTLIEDTSNGTHHHPEVHYIFSDDDSDALIEATQHIQHLRTADSALDTHRQHTSTKSPSGPGFVSNQSTVRERYLVIEIAGDGASVVAAQSLTADWQILDAVVSKAPMLEDDVSSTEDGGEEQRRLMLRIEGIGEIGSGGKDELVGGDGTRRETSIEDEVREFASRMADLCKVVERAEKDVLAFNTGIE